MRYCNLSYHWSTYDSLAYRIDQRHTRILYILKQSEKTNYYKHLAKSRRLQQSRLLQFSKRKFLRIRRGGEEITRVRDRTVEYCCDQYDPIFITLSPTRFFTGVTIRQIRFRAACSAVRRATKWKRKIMRISSRYAHYTVYISIYLAGYAGPHTEARVDGRVADNTPLLSGNGINCRATPRKACYTCVLLTVYQWYSYAAVRRADAIILLYSRTRAVYTIFTIPTMDMTEWRAGEAISSHPAGVYAIYFSSHVKQTHVARLFHFLAIYLIFMSIVKLII